MRLNGKAWMCLVIMAAAVGIILSASRWPFKAALFPMIVGIPLFVLSALQFIITGFKKQVHDKEAVVDFQLQGLEDKKLETKRTLTITLWVLVFFFGVLLVGFPIAVPLFVFCYMKIQGKEKWRTAILFTAGAWAGFYGLFIKFCDIPFMDGYLQQGLRAIGILS
jgi:hypothetical protein